MKYFLTAILKNDALSVVMLSVLLRPELSTLFCPSLSCNLLITVVSVEYQLCLGHPEECADAPVSVQVGAVRDRLRMPYSRLRGAGERPTVQTGGDGVRTEGT